ncbi:MAG: Bug family tripartite tricarboxylate transporter substrate binding protein [Hyphomicrobiaceae bacterium]
MYDFRRIALIGLIAAYGAAVAVPALSQNYPTKHVRIITGNPGTMLDIVARRLGQRLGEIWSQPVVVENRGGAGIAPTIAAQSAPDGYSLLLSDRTWLAVAPSLYRKIAYKPFADFAPITLVASAPQLLVTHPSVPAGNLRDFVSYAKQGPTDFATGGPGTSTHISSEIFRQATGANVVPVNYRGGGAAVMAILGGEVKAGFSLLPVSLPHVKAGKIKAIAITSRNRFAGAPEVPTVAESGWAELETSYWIGLLAPGRTPAELIGRLNREVTEVLQSAAIREMLLAQGAEPTPGTPQEFTAHIKSETAKMKQLIELAGIRAE